MGKHYCDYCDVYLTHDSVSVRKAHNSGRNHLQNVRDYYQSLDPGQLQAIVEEVNGEYEKRGIPLPPVGPAGGFGGGPPGFGGPPRGGFGGPRPPPFGPPGGGYGRPPFPTNGPPPQLNNGPYSQQQQQPPPNFSQPPPNFSRPPPPLGMRPPPGFNPNVPPPGFGQQRPPPGGGPPPPLGMR